MAAIVWTSLTNAVINGDGDLEKNAGADECYTDASGTGDAGGKSTATVASGDFEFTCTLGPEPAGRTFVGIQHGTFSLDFADWDYCIHVSTELNTGSPPHPVDSVFVYEGGTPNKTFRDGIWDEGQTLSIVCRNGVVRYYCGCVLLYTSPTAPTYPLYAVASLACTGSTVVDADLSTGGTGACEAGVLTAPTPGLVVWDETSYYHVVEEDGVISRDPATTGLTVNRQCYAHTETTIADEGDAFEFLVPVPATPGVITIGLGSTTPAATIDCGNESTIYGSACGWLYAYPWFTFQYDPFVLAQDKARVSYDSGTATAAFNVTAATVYRIVICSGKAKFFADGVLKATSTSNVFAESRLTVHVDFSDVQEASVDELISDAKKYTGVSCSTGTGGTEATTSAPGETCAYSWTIPTPDALPLTVGSTRHTYFDEIEGDWGEHGQAFPDGHPSFTTIQTSAIRHFLVEWDGLSAEDAATLDAHWESTRGGLSFSVTHPRTAEVITNCRYESYDRTEHVRYWAQKRTARIVKFTN